MPSFSVYILYSTKLERFYTGTTDDFPKRLAEHNSGEKANAFTRRGIPWEPFILIEHLSSKQAYEIESHIKQMKSSGYIRNLKKYPEMVEKLKLSYLVRPR